MIIKHGLVQPGDLVAGRGLDLGHHLGDHFRSPLGRGDLDLEVTDAGLTSLQFGEQLGHIIGRGYRPGQLALLGAEFLKLLFQGAGVHVLDR